MRDLVAWFIVSPFLRLSSFSVENEKLCNLARVRKNGRLEEERVTP